MGRVQPPWPLQIPVGMWVVPMHDSVPQVTLAPQNAQCPAPSQSPVVRHVDEPVAVQSLRGSVPWLAGWHCPSGWPVRVMLHAVQGWVQAEPQQTPLTQ